MLVSKVLFRFVCWFGMIIVLMQGIQGSLKHDDPGSAFLILLGCMILALYITFERDVTFIVSKQEEFSKCLEHSFHGKN